jgi:DNA mismatch endonuclease (patch repair protein)
LPELALRRELHARGFRYRLQKEVIPRRRVDIAFVNAKTAVDVRGCFWHGCSDHFAVPKSNPEWWVEKIESNRTRDMETESLLKGLGWRVVVVWEHESPMLAADRIEAVLRERSVR